MAALSTHEELTQKINELEREIVARDKAMAVLQEDFECYSTLVDNAHDLIHSVTPEGSFLFVNRAWRETLGYNDDDLQHLSLMDIVDDSCKGACRTIFTSLINGQQIDRNETTFVTKDGGRILVEGRCRTSFKNGKATAMTGIFRDISDRARSEKELRESEKRYRDLFENTTDLIQILLPDGRFLYVNPAWCKTLGYSQDEIEGLTILDLIDFNFLEHCRLVFQQINSEEKVNFIDATFVAKDGKKILLEGNAICKFQDGKPALTQCILRDVSQKRNIEEELLKSQKLESLGIFAGGIAHDFNNLLTSILGNVALAKLTVGPHNAIYEQLAETEKAIKLATKLTQQLLTFSTGGAPIKKTTTITELIVDSTSFALRGANVKCDYRLAENLLPLAADQGQLSQVIQNLVINASQAMPDGGTVIIRGKNITLDAQRLTSMPAGKYVALSFEDHGIGIPAEHLPKIFDPYFTTKETGSGLGLAIAYSIIKNHDGWIDVDSEVDRGTTFTVYLPAEKDVIVHPKRLKKEKACVPQVRVLVMDDEAMVRSVVARMLQHFSCESVAASDGREAIDLYQQAMAIGRPFGAVIMDLTVPGAMGGQEALAKLMVIDPGIKAVVSSGYANDPVMANFKQYGFSGVLPKPFSAEQLGEVLAKIMPVESE